MDTVRVLLILVLGIVSLRADTTLEQAQKLYNTTQYTQAVALLKPDQSKEAAVLLLAGKSYLMLGDYKRSVDLLRKASTIQPGSSDIWHWLGKAHGRRAEHSSFLTAPKYAVDCRSAFEKAVELDPKNIEAMQDLMEYYLEAPGFLGGGTDKAATMAKRIGALDPVEKHFVEARLAEKRKDVASAEQHLRAAVELAPKEIGRIVDLARFLARHGKRSDSEAAFEKAARISPTSPLLVFHRAETYIDEKRNPSQARDLLKLYLTLNLTPDDPPRAEAEKLLAKLPKG